MKSLPYILIAVALSAFYSCGKQQTDSETNQNDEVSKTDKKFDFSLFYHVYESEDYIYDAHRKVPVDKMVTLNDLDNLFGDSFYCDTVNQTVDWALNEQEHSAAKFMPKEVGDTLVMMRRIYGNPGDWMIWIDLEIKETDSLRVLCFLAYDNSQIDI